MSETVPSAADVYSARLVFPMTAPPIVNGAVAVHAGRILHVGTREWVLETLAERGYAPREHHWRGVILPGLVDAHTHLQYTQMAEVGQARYGAFEEWSRAFQVVYDRGGHDWGAAARAGAEQLIRYGVTAAADVVTDLEAASALHDLGLHGIAYWEVMGWDNASWRDRGRDQVLAELGGMVQPPGVGLSPHAPYSLDTEPLMDVPDIVRQRGLRLHIHMGESEFESEFVGSGAGKLADLWRSWGVDSFRALREKGFGVSSAQFVDHLGVLGPDCHVAHGVYLRERDRELLRLRGTSVALCPRSNAVIGLDEAPVAAYLRDGNPIAVGTDSLSSSPSLDLMEDVKLLADIARRQGYSGDDLRIRLLSAATLGGATAMGIHLGEDRVGQLAVGAVADLALFDADVRTAGWSASDRVTEARLIGEVLEQLVDDGPGRVAATVIHGAVRYARDGSLAAHP